MKKESYIIITLLVLIAAGVIALLFLVSSNNKISVVTGDKLTAQLSKAGILDTVQKSFSKKKADGTSEKATTRVSNKKRAKKRGSVSGVTEQEDTTGMSQYPSAGQKIDPDKIQKIKNPATQGGSPATQGGSQSQGGKQGCTPGQNPWIEITSPQGGATYLEGDTIQVEWDSCNLPSNAQVKAELVMDNIPFWQSKPRQSNFSAWKKGNLDTTVVPASNGQTTLQSTIASSPGGNHSDQLVYDRNGYYYKVRLTLVNGGAGDLMEEDIAIHDSYHSLSACGAYRYPIEAEAIKPNQTSLPGGQKVFLGQIKITAKCDVTITGLDPIIRDKQNVVDMVEVEHGPDSLGFINAGKIPYDSGMVPFGTKPLQTKTSVSIEKGMSTVLDITGQLEPNAPVQAQIHMELANGVFYDTTSGKYFSRWKNLGGKNSSVVLTPK